MLQDLASDSSLLFADRLVVLLCTIMHCCTAWVWKHALSAHLVVNNSQLKKITKTSNGAVIGDIISNYYSFWNAAYKNWMSLFEDFLLHAMGMLLVWECQHIHVREMDIETILWFCMGPLICTYWWNDCPWTFPFYHWMLFPALHYNTEWMCPDPGVIMEISFFHTSFSVFLHEVDYGQDSLQFDTHMIK